MPGFASLVQNNPMVYVPLSPLLNTAFSMMFQKGQQKRAIKSQEKMQSRQMMMQGIGMAADLGGTLGGASLMSSALKGSGGAKSTIPDLNSPSVTAPPSPTAGLPPGPATQGPNPMSLGY